MIFRYCPQMTPNYAEGCIDVEPNMNTDPKTYAIIELGVSADGLESPGRFE
jgi:hypothetical protein